MNVELPTLEALRRRAARDRAVEAVAALFGIAGALLLACTPNAPFAWMRAIAPYAGWGFAFFLVSNVGWIAFAWIRGHRWLLVQQAGFTLISLLGIWSWLL